MSRKNVNETYTISDGAETITNVSKYDFKESISRMFEITSDEASKEVESVISELADKAERGDDYSAECAYLDITITLE